MRVSELAKRLAVTPDTVRYYTRIGYLVPIRNNVNRYREFSEKDIQRLRFILSARQMGFTVDDIGKILSESDKGKSPCSMTRILMEQRLQETEQRFQEMVVLRKNMKSALTSWQSKPNKAPTAKMICHLIEEFDGKPFKGKRA